MYHSAAMTDRVNTTAAEGTNATQRGAERRARLSPELRAYAERLAETVDFRVRLRELRSTLGVTQAAAAEITGENQGDISRMESGELNPSVTRANRILQRLGEYATTLTEPAAAPIPVRRISRRPIVNADVAAAYLCAVYDDEDSFSQLKLQKLLYYAQGYALALLGRPLFGDRIEAWDHGPVVPGVWQAHTQHQARPLPRPETFDVVGVDPEARAVLDRVYAELGQFEAWRLRDMTHDEPPWRDTPHNETIPLDRLRDYFTSRLSATEGTREIRGADNVPTGAGTTRRESSTSTRR